MKSFFSELSNDQLTALANLCFDLAKGSFAFAFLPATEGISSNPQLILKILLSTLIGLAFTDRGLLLLKMKERL